MLKHSRIIWLTVVIFGAPALLHILETRLNAVPFTRPPICITALESKRINFKADG
jgi:hypothetical protein